MNANAIKKVNHFGKAGKIVMTILLIAAILVTLVSGVATIYTATLPKDAVKVTVTNHAEFKIDEGSLDLKMPSKNMGRFSLKVKLSPKISMVV